MKKSILYSCLALLVAVALITSLMCIAAALFLLLQQGSFIFS